MRQETGLGHLLGVTGGIAIGIKIKRGIETAGIEITGTGIVIGDLTVAKVKYQVLKVCEAMTLLCWVCAKYDSTTLVILLVPTLTAITSLYILSQPFQAVKYFSQSEFKFETT